MISMLDERLDLMLSRRMLGGAVLAVVMVVIAVFILWQASRISLDVPLARSTSQVVYLQYDTKTPGDADVYLLDVESGKITQLTTNHRVKRAEWTANGESLVLRIGEKQRLELLANGQTQSLPDSEGYTPIFSPDRTHFAYDNCPYDTGSTYGWQESAEIVVVETANPANSRVIENACFPAWSPQSNQIAFTSQQSADADPEIYIETLDGSEQHRLTTNPGADVFPTWSPNTSHIVFRTVLENDPHTIYRIDVDGQRLTQIDHSYRDNSPLVWSPDGQTLLYTNALETLCILRGNANTSNCFLRNILDVVWSSDGTQAVYNTPNGLICLTDPLTEALVEKRCFPGTESARFLAWRP
jgi:Tol biopolymer transport system component